MRLEIRANGPKDDDGRMIDPRISLLGCCGDFSIILEGVDITKGVKKLTLNLSQDEWTMATIEMEVGELEINADADVFLRPGEGASRQNITNLNQMLHQLHIMEERKARGDI